MTAFENCERSALALYHSSRGACMGAGVRACVRQLAAGDACTKKRMLRKSVPVFLEE
jgi:hypothetical protein